MKKVLQRSEQNKILAGVCSGLADYFSVDVSWVRAAFLLALFAGCSGGLIYIILWIAQVLRIKIYQFFDVFNIIISLKLLSD